MKIIIPYNIFIFIWAVVGVAVLGYDLLHDLINATSFGRPDYRTTMGIFWFCLFLLYVINYVKHKRKSKNISEFIS